jgi:hypothetical protein
METEAHETKPEPPPAPANGDRGVSFVPLGDLKLGPLALTAPVNGIDAAIRSQILPGAKRCYQKSLEARPSEAGTMVLRVQILPTGEVDSAFPTSREGLSSVLAACVATVSRRARFSAPSGPGAAVQLPLTFFSFGKAMPEGRDSAPRLRF